MSRTITNTTSSTASSAMANTTSGTVSSPVSSMTSRAIPRRQFIRCLGAGSTLLVAAGTALAAGSLLGACTPLATGSRRTIVDQGGRTVELPETLSRIFCTNPIGTVDVYLLDPAVLVGWNFKPQAASAAFLDPATLDLPALGVWMGAGNVPNAEAVLAAKPDALLCFWSTDETGVRMADSIASEMRLPVVLLDSNLEHVEETYLFLGKLLGQSEPPPTAPSEGFPTGQSERLYTAPSERTPSGQSERLHTLTSFFATKLALIRRIAQSIPQNELRTIYLAEGKGGLQTDPVGSLHLQDALDLLRTRNVVDLPGSEGQGMGMPNVSVERVLTWNPSAILVSEYAMNDAAQSQLYREILEDRNWNTVPAVAQREVYAIPQSPFSWFGRPPSAFRLLGCLWLLTCLYPRYAAAAGLDLDEEVREFFSLCLHYDLTDSDLDRLLKRG